MILSPAAEGLGAGDCLELHLRGWVSSPGDTSQGPLFQEEQPAERSLPASFVLCLLLKNKFLEETVSPDAWWVPVGRGLRERVWCFSFRRGGGGGGRRRKSLVKGGSDALCFKIHYYSPKEREFVLGAHTPFPANPTSTPPYPQPPPPGTPSPGLQPC